jgi:sortase B
MFNQLTLFLDKSFFEQNKYITIYTTDGVYRYEIFAIYETYSTYSYCQMNFISDNSFVNWCNEMKENSLYSKDIADFTSESRIITLSTCTNGYYSRRYSLQGRLVRVEK